jgi:acetylornithine deacetylase
MVPRVLEMIRALVAMPSASSFDPSRDQGNRGVTHLIASWLDDLGFEIRIDRLPGAPDRANLIATLGPGDGGLVLSGHSDTVGCEPKLWKYDPYAVTVDNGRLYGLGIADMKAFFAMAIEAIRQVPADKLRAPVILVATADEECAMQGARMLSQGQRLRARHAIIGEPTNLVAVRMHKGMLMESIRIRGRSCHSSVPSQGASALDGMLRVMQELVLWRDELQRDHNDPSFEVPFPTLNLGTIRGGDHPNRVCGECELQIDLRPLPGMQLESLRNTLGLRVGKALSGTGLSAEVVSLFAGTEPMMTSSETAIVRAAEQLTGLPAGSAAYGTEAPHFAAMGIDPLLLGPGDIAQAHQPDEYLAIERVDPCIDLLRRMIERLCLA